MTTTAAAADTFNLILCLHFHLSLLPKLHGEAYSDIRIVGLSVNDSCCLVLRTPNEKKLSVAWASKTADVLRCIHSAYYTYILVYACRLLSEAASPFEGLDRHR